jgi:cell division protein FtsQ
VADDRELTGASLTDQPLKVAGMAVGALLLAGSALFAVDYLFRPDTLPVRRVLLEGEFRHVDAKQLSEVMTVMAQGNFLLLDLDALRKQAETVPWLYRASVQRQWPDAVRVRFTEQVLAARWSDGRWVNEAGDVVKLPGYSPETRLPLLDGPAGSAADVLAQYRALNQQAAQVGLEIEWLRLTDRRMWELRFTNQLALTLGRDRPEERMARFVQAWPSFIAARLNQIRRVDLRYTNGFAVEWSRTPGGGNLRPVSAKREG